MKNLFLKNLRKKLEVAKSKKDLMSMWGIYFDSTEYSEFNLIVLAEIFEIAKSENDLDLMLEVYLECPEKSELESEIYMVLFNNP